MHEYPCPNCSLIRPLTSSYTHFQKFAKVVASAQNSCYTLLRDTKYA